MKCRVELQDGTWETQELTPVCSEDYCDSCGDCLVCYAEDKCFHNNDGEHMWIKYKTEATV